jgi:hypothetical protein
MTNVMGMLPSSSVEEMRKGENVLGAAVHTGDKGSEESGGTLLTSQGGTERRRQDLVDALQGTPPE